MHSRKTTNPWHIFWLSPVNKYKPQLNLKGWLQNAERKQNVFKNIELADNPSPEDYLSMRRYSYAPNRIK